MHQSELYKTVINICGAPNSGKSSLASYLFSDLKSKGCNCEIVLEAAKIAIYERTKHKIWNQPLIFGEQLQGLLRVIDEVDVVITDSPIILGIVYTPDCFSSLKEIIEQAYGYFNNYCYVLPIHDNYHNTGRRHQKEELNTLQEKILDVVYDNNTKNKIVELPNHDYIKNTEIIYEHAKLSSFFKG